MARQQPPALRRPALLGFFQIFEQDFVQTAFPLGFVMMLGVHSLPDWWRQVFNLAVFRQVKNLPPQVNRCWAPGEAAAAASCRGTAARRRHSWSDPFARPLRRPCSLSDGAARWPDVGLPATGRAPRPGADAIPA